MFDLLIYIVFCVCSLSHVSRTGVVSPCVYGPRSCVVPSCLVPSDTITPKVMLSGVMSPHVCVCALPPCDWSVQLADKVGIDVDR